MRTTEPVSVDLGNMREVVETHIESGDYADVSEVVQEGLRALEREHEAEIEVMRRMIQESLNDPSPSIPAEEVFARLEERYQEDVRAAAREV